MNVSSHFEQHSQHLRSFSAAGRPSITTKQLFLFCLCTNVRHHHHKITCSPIIVVVVFVCSFVLDLCCCAVYICVVVVVVVVVVLLLHSSSPRLFCSLFARDDPTFIYFFLCVTEVVVRVYRKLFSLKIRTQPNQPSLCYELEITTIK